MSYDDHDGTFANGASGECHECGEPTSEEWHRLCSDCYAEEQGWDTEREPWRKPRPAPGTPPESFVAALAEVRERLERLEAYELWLAQLDQLAARVEALEEARGENYVELQGKIADLALRVEMIETILMRPAA